MMSENNIFFSIIIPNFNQASHLKKALNGVIKQTYKNYEIIIVSNQSGIARGYFKENDYIKLNKWMIKKFEQKKISILDTFYCPHGPDSKCNCRKPQPGMFLEAQQKHNISMQDSWMIGDKETDISAAKNAGIFNTILVKNFSKPLVK